MILTLTATKRDAGDAVPGAPAVFCLPYAGGAGSIFSAWPDALGTAATLYALELPGRGAALRQPPISDPDALMDAVVECILRNAGERPYVLYGHSFGAITAYRMLPRLRAQGRSPRRLVLGACRPPGDPPAVDGVAGYDDDGLAVRLRVLRGPGEQDEKSLLDDPGLRALFMPPLRADLAIDERLRPLPGPPVDVELFALSGSGDPWSGASAMEPWRGLARAGFRHATIEAGHFFTPDLAGSPLLGAALLEPL
jgi:medium-chain acyl-[acyl-carrier-protein] hydrolase